MSTERPPRGGGANVRIASSLPADSSHRPVTSTLYDLVALRTYEHYSPAPAGTRRLVMLLLEQLINALTYLLIAAELG